MRPRTIHEEAAVRLLLATKKPLEAADVGEMGAGGEGALLRLGALRVLVSLVVVRHLLDRLQLRHLQLTGFNVEHLSKRSDYGGVFRDSRAVGGSERCGDGRGGVAFRAKGGADVVVKAEASQFRKPLKTVSENSFRVVVVGSVLVSGQTERERGIERERD